MLLFGYPDYAGSEYFFNWGAVFCPFVAIRSGMAQKIGFAFPDVGDPIYGSRFAVYDSTKLLTEVSVDATVGYHLVDIIPQDIVEGQTYYIAQIPCHGENYSYINMKNYPGSIVFNTDASVESLDDYPFPENVPTSWAGSNSNSILCVAAYSAAGLPLMGPGLVGNNPLIRKVA